MEDDTINIDAAAARSQGYFERTGSALHPSTKVRKVLDLLNDISRDSTRHNPNKIIIFSQWSEFLIEVAIILRAQVTTFARCAYSLHSGRRLAIRGKSTHVFTVDGGMSLEERQRAINRIKDSKTCNIILVTTGAGGAG